MVDDRALAELFSVETGVFSIAAILGLVTWRLWNGLPNVMAQWIEWRKLKAAAKADDWSRLRDEITRLDGRIDTLQRELDLCHEERDEWRSRAIAAEAVTLGRGAALQEAQRIVSTERQADANKSGDVA
jgi:hypothetical protein